MRLWVIVYSQAEYCYISTNEGYIMTYKDYSIAKDDGSVNSCEKKKR